ncbi:MAG: PKD domain-containing protein [Candidatus Micrarchaeota archaeon]
MRFRAILLLSILLFSAGIVSACYSNTYSDDTYSVVKKLFQKDETVYLKGDGMGASPQCFEDHAAKVEYYAPGQTTPTYTNICTSSTCYFPNDASGVVKDQLPLSTYDPSGVWTAKVYRGKYRHSTDSCYWDYRSQTTFNVTNFNYSCSILLTQPQNGSVYLTFEQVMATGHVVCQGDPVIPSDYYAIVEWEEGVTSPPLVLTGPVGGPWQFGSDPDNNHYYSNSGTEYLRARLYKWCSPTISLLEGSCDYIVSTSPWVEIIINMPPVSIPGPDQELALGETAYFNGSASYDADGALVSYLWDFGDNETGTGVYASHTYQNIGEYTVSLTVTDNLGAEDVNSLSVTIGSPQAEYITISPENATVGIGGTREYTATAHNGHGDSWGVTSETEFSSDGGEFEGNLFTAGTTPGTYGVHAEYQGLEAATSVTLITAEAERIEILPENASVVVTGVLLYSSTAYDEYNNSWDVTSDTEFSSDGGAFASNLFGAGTVAGTFEVIGTYGSLSDSTNVEVLPGDATSLQIMPYETVLEPFGTQEYTATASDGYGNGWDVTGQTNFSTEGGVFNGSILTAGVEPGEYIVDGYYVSLHGTADLIVVPGELLYLELSPENITLSAGSSHPYTATAYDEYGNPVDVTDETTFGSDGGAFDEGVFTAGNTTGDYTIEGDYGELYASTQVHITNADAVSITITPKNSTIPAGGSQEYTVTAYDEYGNPWDVTYDSDLASEAGPFEANILTSDGTMGTFEASAEYMELADYASVTVTYGEAAELVLFPESATVSVGDTIDYSSTAYDEYGNSWDATSDTEFSSTEGGTFSGNILTALSPGTYTVTGVYGALTAYASFTVTESYQPGNRGGSSLGFTAPVDEEPAPTCQVLGEACNVTIDCCEGACISSVCIIPEEKPPESRQVELIAPEEAAVGESVEVALRYVDTGEPVPGATIKVVTPSYEILSLLTDEAGTDSYVPQEDGWYDYIVPGYDVIGTVSTHAIGTELVGGRVIIRRWGVAPQQESSSMTGLFLFGLAPEIVGLAMLVFMLLSYGAYLYYKEHQELEIELDIEPLIPMKKIWTKKPKLPKN